MSTQDQEMLARISQLAGQINRHKNQQNNPYRSSIAPYPPRSPAPHSRGSSVSRYAHNSRVAPPPSSGYGFAARRGSAFLSHARVYHGAAGPGHRNRSLVLNGPVARTTGEVDSSPDPGASGSSWVSKNDRHRQLINFAVFEKELAARAKAIERTRLKKEVLRDRRERAMFLGHLNRTSDTRMNNASSARRKITIDGRRYLVAPNGSKLTRVSQEEEEGNDSALPTPKVVMVGNVKFYRSKHGNLYRHGIVKAQQRYSGTVKKVNVPCKIFSTTGSCPNGPRCRFLHDPSKVALCKEFLQKGECFDGDACDLSHDLTAERTPHCLHFAKDACSNPDCRYTHVKVPLGALVCRSFGMYGFCAKGATCLERHVYECPDFSNTGKCDNKNCKLLHRERASVLRKASQAAKDQTHQDEEMDDVSSVEDSDADEDEDVDSDEVDEFIEQGEHDEVDLAQEQDFIQL